MKSELIFVSALIESGVSVMAVNMTGKQKLSMTLTGSQSMFLFILLPQGKITLKSYSK